MEGEEFQMKVVEKIKTYMSCDFLTKIVPLTKNTAELVVRFGQKNMTQKPIRCAYRLIFFSAYWA
jgi:hypothetical protein